MASNKIEIESKILLSKKDYERLASKLGFSEKEIVQTNYYRDSTDRKLKKYGMVIRLRKTGDEYVLTRKAPLSEGLLEKNQYLSQKDADSLISHNVFPRGDIADVLVTLHLPASELRILAELTTHRREAVYKDTDLDISKNEYGKKVDYELECDSDSAVKSQNTLQEICENYDLEFKLNTLSKETRAINAALEGK